MADNDTKSTAGSGDTDAGSNQGDTVSYATYQKVMDQLKSTQTKMKTLNDTLAEIQLEKQNTERKQLEEKEEFKKLYETEKANAQALISKITNYEQNQIKSLKLSALRSKVSVARDDYLSFAELDKIVVNDGVVDEDSVNIVAENFKKNHTSLLKQSNNTNATVPTTPFSQPSKPLSELSESEINQQLAKLFGS